MRTDRREDDKGPTWSSAGRPRDARIDAAIFDAIFRIIIRHDAPLDTAWVNDLITLIASGWTTASRGG